MFAHVAGIEACFLKVSVDVAGESGATVLHRFTPSFENVKAWMGNDLSVQVEPMAVEALRVL